jgi:hypothetical protein
LDEEAEIGAEVGLLRELDAETGHTVVYKGIVSVTTVVDRAGQFVTVGAQDVVVKVFVVYTVEVVNGTDELPVVEWPPAVEVLFGYVLLLVGSVETVELELDFPSPFPPPQVRFLYKVAVSRTVALALLINSWVR